MKKLRRTLFNFFIPHEHNNFRARLLHLDVLTFHFFVGLVLLILIQTTPQVGKVLGFATDITIDKLLLLTNKSRQENGLSSLTLNNKLSQAAALKGADMMSKNYWAHYAPDGTTPWEFFKRAGYDYEYAGENLAKNFLYSDNVVYAWMASESHRENILRPEYSQVGFAIVNGKLEGEDTTLVVQFFGKPVGEGVPLAREEATPQTIETRPLANPQTLASQNQAGSGFSLPLNLTTLIILFLVATFAIDLYFASRLNVFHIHGKNVAHLIFLGFALLGLVVISQGIIL